MGMMNMFTKDERMNTFTTDEQVILKNVSSKYKWIARDMNGGLFVYKRKPKKRLTVYGDAGDGAGRFPIGPFEELFKKVTWDGGPLQFRKDVLDETERKYLEAVLRPFRNRVVRVTKLKFPACSDYYLRADLENGDCLAFPNFPAGTMYNGMKLGHEYSLEELGITY